MTKRTRITNEKFSVTVCTVANSYGFKTIGSLYKFLKQCNPSAKLGLGTGHIRVFTLLKEIEYELQNN